MNAHWWRACLVIWMLRYGYASALRLVSAWRWAGEECWQDYRDGGMTAHEAILEDASYG
jgi:hypothetical protein